MMEREKGQKRNGKEGQREKQKREERWRINALGAAGDDSSNRIALLIERFL